MPRKSGPKRTTPTGHFSALRALTIRLKFRSFSKSSPDRTRTCDKAVNSRLLYQLSYRGLRAGFDSCGANVSYCSAAIQGGFSLDFHSLRIRFDDACGFGTGKLLTWTCVRLLAG